MPQREFERNLALLAETGTLLAQTLDTQERLAALTRVVVPRLADWCAIDVLDESGKILRVGVHHPDPEKVKLAHALHARYPPDMNAPHGVPHVLRTGATEWMASIPDELLVASTVDAEHLQATRELRLCSYIAAPLIAHGKVLGALTLVYAESERHYNERDLSIAEELGRRAGIAIENARLYQQAEASRAHLHGLFSQAPAPILITRGTEQRVELVNEAYQQLVGGRLVVGRSLGELLPELKGQPLLEVLDRVLRSGKPERGDEVAVRLVGPGGNEEERFFNFVYHPMKGTGPRVEGVMTLAFEVTHQVRAREREALIASALREERAALETLNQVGQLISAELDQQKLVQAITDFATRLTGAQFGAFFYNVEDDRGEAYTLYTISGVPREAFSKFPMPRNTKVFSPTFAGEGIVRVADITQDARYGQNPPYHGMPQGHLPVVSYLAVPVVSRAGKVIGGLFFGHETAGVFTERHEKLIAGVASQAAVAMDNAALFRDAQRLIKALERSNADLDQFAYVASHDLKAPLRGISNLAQWLEEDLGGNLSEDSRKHLDLLRGRARRMEALIDGILQYSRAARTKGKLETIDVGSLVREAIELIPTPPNARIEIQDSMPTLRTEKVPLEQTLMNLIVNALKHSGRPDVRVSIVARSLDGHVQFSVSDNGIGIAPEFQERVFGIFQTLEARDKVEGTGIGLAIVKKVVEARGGRIWIESSPGQGATFHFTWPKEEGVA